MVSVDEKARRRLGVDTMNSVAVVLADGQPWLFPKPWLEIRPNFESGRANSSCQVLTYGDDLDHLITAVGHCRDDDAIIASVASLGAYLLLVNYELADHELPSLFQFRLGDERSLQWAKQIVDIATGQAGPKVFGGGGG